MDKPAWYNAAVKEIGQRELPENRGPVICRYIAARKAILGARFS